MVTACEVVRVEFKVVSDPKFSLSPYSICESEGRSVCQVIVAVDEAIDSVSMAEIITERFNEVLPTLTVVDSGTVTCTSTLPKDSACPELVEWVVKVSSDVTVSLPNSSLEITR